MLGACKHYPELPAPLRKDVPTGRAQKGKGILKENEAWQMPVMM